MDPNETPDNNPTQVDVNANSAESNMQNNSAPQEVVSQPQLTPEAIAAAVQQGLQSNQPQPQLSQEEINERMRVWNPNDDFSQQFAQALMPNEEGAVNVSNLTKVLGQMHQSQMAQAQTYAQMMVEQAKQQIQEMVNPLQTAYQQQQQKAMQDEFVNKYPVLKNHAGLIQAAATQLKSTGAVFTSKEQLYPALASTMEQMIKAINPNFTLANAQPSQQPNVNPASVMNGSTQQTSSQPVAGKSAAIW